MKARVIAIAALAAITSCGTTLTQPDFFGTWQCVIAPGDRPFNIAITDQKWRFEYQGNTKTGSWRIENNKLFTTYDSYDNRQTFTPNTDDPFNTDQFVASTNTGTPIEVRLDGTKKAVFATNTNTVTCTK